MSSRSTMIVGVIALSLMAFGAIAVMLDPRPPPGHIGGVHIRRDKDTEDEGTRSSSVRWCGLGLAVTARGRCRRSTSQRAIEHAAGGTACRGNLPRAEKRAAAGYSLAPGVSG
jgi:hypothetical protein